MDIGLMVEGQNGLTWERWRHILQLAERLGFPTVFRSDHYFIGQQQDSLDAYLSFVMAASETSSIRFGPLVSPVTFRSPVDVARMAAQVDVLSGGRFVMGMGAGWNEPEHVAYGIPFPPVRERFDRLEEAIHVAKALWEPGPATYEGRYYRLDGAECLPKPSSPGRPPILIGGGGEKRTLKLVAKYADEWNCVNLSPDAYAAKVAVLERHCEAEGRDPATIRRSMMAFGIVGPTERDLDHATAVLQGMFARPGAAAASPAEFREGLRARGMLVGTTDQVVDTLGQLAGHGLQEVQFQHFNFDDDAVPEYLAAEVAPRVRGV
ncbi:MAG: LLM class F420-dependent oxidoreductase [Dehalococcoidia bacterium]|nr:LLM class F420-dependent oxidoreductase [Dehalococcoidia bacterium]